MKLIAIQDFTANQFFFDRPSPNSAKRLFRKGASIEAKEQGDFGGNKHLVSSDGFDIPKNTVKEFKGYMGGSDGFGWMPVKNPASSKYIFTQDAKITTYVPPMSGMPVRIIIFKKGDMIEGVLVNNNQSEQPAFVDAQTPLGKVRIDFGGRGGSVIVPYKEGVKTDSTTTGVKPTPPTGDVKTDSQTTTKTGDGEKTASEDDDKILGMPKVAFYVGLGAIVLIGGFIVYKKFIVKK